MTRELLISATTAEVRSALIDDGVVVELSFDRLADASVVGNIYLGRVERVMHAMNAVFVDIGLDRPGFLPAGRGGGDASPADGAALPHEGASVLVQAVKDPLRRKGAELSRRLALPGRLLVMRPGRGGVRVSRRIVDEAERGRLVGLVEDLAGPDEGFIVRTVAKGAGREGLEHDVRRLREAWASIRGESRTASAPARLHAETDPVTRVLRDHALEGIDSVVVDDDGVAETVRGYTATEAPGLPDRLVEHAPGEDMFESFGVAEEIERAGARHVRLRSGAGLVIESVEALTAIDVDSRSSGTGRDPEHAAFEVNREAATEALRQIRLRNLSGLIVIDFINMARAEHWSAVIRALEEGAGRDRVPTRVLGRTGAGLVEIVRRRQRRPLRQLMAQPCGVCGGTGATMSVDAASVEILRALRRASVIGGGVAVRAAPEVAAALGGRYSDFVDDMEVRTARRIEVLAESGFQNHRYEIVPR